MTDTKYATLGADRGKAAGTWMFDGNTPESTVAYVLRGYNDGDPIVMDLMPNPLSGEWAGESIPELFGLATGDEWPSDIDLDEFETAFRDAFWDEVVRSAHAILGTDGNV